MPILTLVRGLPGAGKSTVARALADTLRMTHVEADMYFEQFNGGTFDPTLLTRAHEWCYDTAQRALEDGQSVVVANTFTRKWELIPYVLMGRRVKAQLQLIEVQGPFASVHKVPSKPYAAMVSRWEQITLKDLETS